MVFDFSLEKCRYAWSVWSLSFQELEGTPAQKRSVAVAMYTRDAWLVFTYVYGWRGRATGHGGGITPDNADLGYTVVAVG